MKNKLSTYVCLCACACIKSLLVYASSVYFHDLLFPFSLESAHRFSFDVFDVFLKITNGTLAFSANTFVREKGGREGVQVHVSAGTD